MTDSTTGPVVSLDDDSCWTILSGNEVGRLVTVVDREPEIFPVNFVVDGRSVLFRTAEGSKLFSITINERVAFEVDGWDATGGWSVILRGSAHELTHSADVARAESLPLRPWVATHKTHWVRVDADQISGRRFHFGPEPSEAEDASD